MVFCTGCGKEVSKNAKGSLCRPCYQNRKKTEESTSTSSNDEGINAFLLDLGVQCTDIEDISLPEEGWLKKPMAEIEIGQFLKIISGTIFNSHKKLEKQITDINEIVANNVTEREQLKAANNELNQKMKLQNARIKNLEENDAKMKSIITKHQSMLMQQDRLVHMKRLIFSGIPENEEWKVQDNTAYTEKQKVELILKHLEKSEIRPIFVRRVGNIDQGPQKRP